MEYSLTLLAPKGAAGILCLNPYSNGILPDFTSCENGVDGTRLNPYSNGILPDNLSESELHFLPFIFSYSFSLFRQGVSPIRILFSQM